ncbi:DUF3604 domain-containing protein [Rhodobacteraceae bacterium NNCM2]|nr:DUF3604 domain-containing protein [Coraliihabitans acroporae]
MAPIPRANMGDVWPSVEPGRQAREYGSARLDPVDPCEIRSFQTLTITYTVGRFGLDDTGAIRIAMRWVSDSGAIQTDDPQAMNYVTARASNGAPLVTFVEPYGYRPWSLALRITVAGGYMREGDTITVVIGDRSGGSPGYRLQTIAEAAFEFKVSVDSCATGYFNELEDQLWFPIVAGPVHRWAVVAPGQRRPGEAFALGIRAEDLWGNPALPAPGPYRLVPDRRIDGLPATVSFAPGVRALRVEGLRLDVPGTVRVTLTAPDGTPLAISNPIVIRDAPDAGYWGDLHGQSGETVGIGTIEEYQGFARDIAFLDVSGHQSNDFQTTTPFWEHINRTTAAFNESGRFVIFPGYEWSGNTPVGGDHNVFFREEGRQIRRSSHAMLADRSDLDTDANTLDTLFSALRGEDCVLWSHVGGRPADVSFAHDPALKTAVEVHSNWGMFEWILTDSIALGHRIGVVANSDGHKGRPGAGPPGATEFGAYGGLTCFLAPELTREAIFEAMRRRHHYGTSGSRITLDLRTEFAGEAFVFERDPRHFDAAATPTREAMMGDIIRTADPQMSLSISIDAPAPIERVDVMQGSDLIQCLRPYQASDLGNRVRVLWQGAEYRGRGRNTHWQGEITVDGGEITEMTPINHWNIERQLEMTDPRHIAFEAVTSGNFGGVDLRLDNPDARIGVATNLVSGEAPLSDLGLEDLTLDAGGLERQIRLRRLPDEMKDFSLSSRISIDLPGDEDAAIWVRVTTLDGHHAWSSPIYVERP